MTRASFSSFTFSPLILTSVLQLLTDAFYTPLLCSVNTICLVDDVAAVAAGVV